MMNPRWVEIDRDGSSATFAMNMPTGVLFRVVYAFDPKHFELQFVPQIKAVKNPDGDGYILCHG
ncbi:hypothetical protein Asfd1_81 [Aeromonas phage Asfd_1]|nr:hypothetical protein Asfd1_81 [Aeromonas phage Asfd_1]